MNPSIIQTYLLLAIGSATIAALLGVIHILIVVVVMVVSDSKKNESKEER